MTGRPYRGCQSSKAESWRGQWDGAVSLPISSNDMLRGLASHPKLGAVRGDFGGADSPTLSSQGMLGGIDSSKAARGRLTGVEQHCCQFRDRVYTGRVGSHLNFWK